jgi:polysaccharide biosynthesis/export protein
MHDLTEDVSLGPARLPIHGLPGSCHSLRRFWCIASLPLLLLGVRTASMRAQTFSPSTETQPVSMPHEIAGAQALQTAREANDRIAQLALVEAAQHRDYVISSGDLLSIEVFDVAELSRDVRVSESGFVAMPLVPVKVQASGLTPFQFQDKLAELLQANGLVTHPHVTVTVKEQHSEPITVIGAVRNPLTIQAVHQMTLLQVLSQAGGIADDAGSQVLVTRKLRVPESDNHPGDTASSEMTKAQSANISQGTENTTTVDLNDLLDSGNPKYNVPLFGGDVVTVPRAGVVYAVGAVQHPGGFVMQSDRQRLTVLKVLSLAGGLTSTAKGGNAVILRQPPGSQEREQLPIDVKKILSLKREDVSLRQNDILYVPDSTGKHALRRSAEIAIAIATGAAIIRVTQ